MLKACCVDSGCIEERVEHKSKLQHELKRAQRRLRDEDTRIASFKNTLKNSTSILAQLLSVR